MRRTLHRPSTSRYIYRSSPHIAMAQSPMAFITLFHSSFLNPHPITTAFVGLYLEKQLLLTRIGGGLGGKRQGPPDLGLHLREFGQARK